MEENKPKRTVGISGLNMDNSSISHTKIDGSNSDANVGIFDTEMKDAEITGLDIKDEKKSSATLKKSLIKRLLYNPYVIGLILIAIEEITFGKIYKTLISIF